MAKGRHLRRERAGGVPVKAAAALALAAASAWAAFAQEAELASRASVEDSGSERIAISSALPDEAPKSLFSASLGKEGEADAELYVKGTWSAELIGSLVFQKTSSSDALELSSASPLLFTQDPDLFLSFLLFKKVFVEAKVTRDIAQSRFAGGYRGGEGELLKEARIGNDGISFPSLPFLSFGDGSYRSFGASARIESGGFTGRAMVRYDQADRVTKKFIGGSEVAETEISPNAFISGKYFAANNTPCANLEVFVQSASGSLAGDDGNTYRKLGPSEYSYSAATGFITLAAAATTRVAIRYDGLALPANAVTIGGALCDLAYEPPPETSIGILYPRLQVLCRYATTAKSESADAYVVDAASGLRDDGFEARIDDSGFVEIIWNDVSAPGAALDPAYRRPFEDADSGEAWIYGTDFSDPKIVGNAPVFSKRIVVRSFSPSSSISIDKDVVAGSVEVRRNGVQDFAFTVDSENYVVKLALPPSPSEEIEVSYMKESAERRAGLISAAVGGFWKLEENWSAWSALGASWSVPGQSYAADGATSPGKVSLTGGEKYSDGKLAHQAAIAASYSRDDATGRYRIEGMESSGSYASSFRPAALTSGYSIVETKEDELDDNFPDLVGLLHKDGATQQALRIEAQANKTILPAAPDSFQKIVYLPPYESFKTFSFLARIPINATLALRLDDGAGTVAIGAENIIGSSYAGKWTRFIVHYGSGDASVYYQTGDHAAELPATGAYASYNALARCSRIIIELTGTISIGDVAWIDEICLEDSVGRLSAIFQGSMGYKDDAFRIGDGSLPWISGIEASADAQGGASDGSFASGGASLKTTVGFLGLGVKARASASDDSSPSMSGGHELTLPAVAFPVTVRDSFDLDPATGAFGREDSATAAVGRIASATFAQKTTWTPPAYIAGDGLLAQQWSGKLSLADSIVSIGLDATNRSLPSHDAAIWGKGGYFDSWIGSFEYALPAFEEYSARRSAAATLSARWRKGAENSASFALGTVVEPEASAAGYRRLSSSMKIALPLDFQDLSIAPYYSRSWKDKREGAGAGLADDAARALADFADAPIYYASLPFAELVSSSWAEDFSAQTSGVAQALLSAELGFTMSRKFGSRWYDLVLPSALAAAFRRELSRDGDSVADAGVWEASAKWASVNLFGKLGAYPSGLSFDSDEYLGMMKASLSVPRGGGASTVSIQSQALATLYAGASDRLDLDNRFSIDSAPSSGSWSEDMKISISRRVERHFLLSLYRLAVPAKVEPPRVEANEDAAPGPAAEGGKTSVASRYLEGLASLEPVARSILSFSGGIEGRSGDATGSRLGWRASESYEARVTLPETLTLKASASLTQSKDVSSGALSLGFLLSLGATISF
jgi:hypothetical protein